MSAYYLNDMAQEDCLSSGLVTRDRSTPMAESLPAASSLFMTGNRSVRPFVEPGESNRRGA